MHRHRVPEGIGRPLQTIHNAQTLSAWNAINVAEFRPGRYVVTMCGEGGAGAIRYQSYDYTQGGGEAGASFSLIAATYFSEKPAVKIGTGLKPWEGGGRGDVAMVGSYVALGGLDGSRGPAVFNPAPTGSSVAITLYNELGLSVGTKQNPNVGGYGWRSESQLQTSGAPGFVQLFLEDAVI